MSDSRARAEKTVRAIQNALLKDPLLNEIDASCAEIQRAIDDAVAADRRNIRKYHVCGDEEHDGGTYVEWRGQRYGKGPTLWAVTFHGRCLNHDGWMEWEPSPSNRDDAFIARCRWTSFDDALAAAIRARDRRRHEQASG